MKAIICTKYGGPDVLQLQEIEKPTPKENEILIKIHASSVTTADTMMRTGKPYFGRLFMGLSKPKTEVTGTGFSGIIETVGENVTLFEKGEAVFGESIFGAGTNTEYVCVAEDGIVISKPSNILHEEAASICDGALTSMNFLKNLGHIKKGQKILINGASGSLGSAAIQLAKYFEAEVTAVCSVTNFDLVKSLGAAYTIDYTKEDFTKNNQQYDIIYDTVGKISYIKCCYSLAPSGIFMSPVLSISLLFQMMITSLFSKRKAKFSATGILPVKELNGMLIELKEIIISNKLNSVIDKTYSLKQAEEAHTYVGEGHKKGNVVIRN
jgi:NADPH:quinone reductase-like Zn-dependent oxidoreductase